MRSLASVNLRKDFIVRGSHFKTVQVTQTCLTQAETTPWLSDTSAHLSRQWSVQSPPSYLVTSSFAQTASRYAFAVGGAASISGITLSFWAAVAVLTGAPFLALSAAWSTSAR